MSTNRSLTLDGRFLPAEYFAVGHLREGIWDVGSRKRDSRSTWHLDGNVLTMRIPWSMLAMGDPSSHTAVQPVKGRPTAVTVKEIVMLVDAGAGGSATAVVRWDGWQQAEYSERLKPGIQPLVDAWNELGTPARR